MEAGASAKTLLGIGGTISVPMLVRNLRTVYDTLTQTLIVVWHHENQTQIPKLAAHVFAHIKYDEVAKSTSAESNMTLVVVAFTLTLTSSQHSRRTGYAMTFCLLKVPNFRWNYYARAIYVWRLSSGAAKIAPYLSSILIVNTFFMNNNRSYRDCVCASAVYVNAFMTRRAR